jgi:hypothetical protein
MNPMLRDKIAASELQMRARLQEARATFSHRGTKGSVVEEAFRDFVRQYIPRRLEVGHGEVVDSFGRRSAQTDLVIASEDHPFTFTSEQPGLFFIEGVLAAGEIKSLLTTDELRKALENSARFKELEVKPVTSAQAFAAPADLQRYYKWPPWFLFAFESQLSLNKIGTTIVDFVKARGLSPVRVVDAVFVLDRGYMINLGDGQGGFAWRSPAGEWLTGWQWSEEKDVLFNLLGWISVVMPRMTQPAPILTRYLIEEYSGKANVEKEDE